MLGLVEWSTGGRVRYEVKRTAGLRCLYAEVPRSVHTPQLLQRYRCERALSRMAKQGVKQVILPKDSGLEELLTRFSLQTVSTVPLRQRMAADWVACALAEQGMSGVKIAVSAAHLTSTVVQTITELALRHRYLLLELPYGGEELCRSLRREYGVSPQLNPGWEIMSTAEVWLAFDPVERAETRLLPLYDERVPMPGLLLPPLLEEQIPQTVDRERFLAAMQEAGCLRRGQIALCRETMP